MEGEREEVEQEGGVAEGEEEGGGGGGGGLGSGLACSTAREERQWLSDTPATGENTHPQRMHVFLNGVGALVQTIYQCYVCIQTH